MTNNSEYCFQLSNANPSGNMGGKAESLFYMHRKSLPIPKTLIVGKEAFRAFSKEALVTFNTDIELNNINSIHY